MVMILLFVSLLIAPVGPDIAAAADWGFFSGGTIHIIPTSHQDVAWMDSPETCTWWRDTQLITPSLDILKEHADYRIFMEYTLMLKEYLERHPERRDEILRYTREGRLEWGATYNQPYESLLSGEQLVRQTYLGRKWLRKTLPGCDAVVAWNVDVPARALQMPQILSKAGIKYLIHSRFDQGFYRWQSPDGSGILSYSPDRGHYGNPHDLLQGTYDEVVAKLSERLKVWGPYHEEHKLPPSFSVIDGRDFEQTSDYYPLMRKWNSSEGNPPNLKYSTAAEFMESVGSREIAPEVIIGERPDVWLYIHGPTHHWAISAMREAGRLLPAAETFAAFDALLSGNFRNYPAEEFNEAWAEVIFPDHGWGGRNGDITDHLFRTKLESARNTGSRILTTSLESIASRVRTGTRGLPLIIFNTLSWKRTAPVECEFLNPHASFSLIDAAGNPVPFQPIPYPEHLVPFKQENTFANRTVRITFIAENIPALGYKTYYIAPSETGNNDSGDSNSGNSTQFENNFYRITLSGGGIKSIFDKELGKEILKTDTFLGGDIFTLKSEGNGAGEFSDVQQPTLEGFDKMSAHNPEWKCKEEGPVRIKYEYREDMPHCTVIADVTIYKTVKRIDFDVALMWFDGTKSREFRFALPVNIERGQVAYEVPMGVLEVGKDEIRGAAGERYTTECKSVHPREVQNFLSVSGEDFGVTLSSPVAVCDYIDPVHTGSEFTILQPILLASRKSCHGWGNWYQQPGDHHYRFSLTSHRAGWENGMYFGIGANNPLIPIIQEHRSPASSLPEETSFVSLSSDNVIVSTIKKCDDDDSIILRFYENLGKDSNISIASYFPFSGAKRVNIIEDETGALPAEGRSIALRVGHNAIETVKLIPDWNK